MVKFVGDPTEPWLTTPLLNLVPEHTRTSCDDKNVRNGMPHYEDGGARCNRCAMLLFLQGNWFSLIEVDVDVSVRWIKGD